MERIFLWLRPLLYVSTERKPEKLFYLQEDPFESVNLIASDKSQHQEAIKKFMKVVETFPTQDHDPKYNPHGPQPRGAAITVKSQEWKK